MITGLELRINVSILTVFHIRDILIHIRILGSVHWITGPDLDPALFAVALKMPTENKFSLQFFGLFLFVGTVTPVFNDKM